MNGRLETLLRAGPEALMGTARMKLHYNSPSARVMPYAKRPKKYVVGRQNPALAPNFKPKGIR